MILPRSLSPLTPVLRRHHRDRLVPNPKATLAGQLHEVMRFFHYSPRTESAYWQWIVRFLRHHKRRGVSGAGAWRHPKDMGAAEVRAFLTHLASALGVSAGVQDETFWGNKMRLGESENFPRISGQRFSGGLGGWDTAQDWLRG